MDIKNIYDAVIFTSAAITLRDAVLDAIKQKTNLISANLRYADLSYANLSSANLRYADLSYANLISANLRSANLSSANLSYANLSSANLSYANLSSANLRYANLSYANLSSANLSYANLSEIKNAELTLARIQFIPTEGPFVGWKKCRDGVIVKLGISASAKRSHGLERKCRCSKAKVLEVFGAEFGVSLHNEQFEYHKNKIVIPDGWDENRWNVCGQGVHFYLTREEAEANC